MNRNLSFKERLHNAMGVQAIEDLKAIHAYTHATMHSREEWDRIWYPSDAATWAHGFGRMVGWDQVYINSVTYTDQGMSGLNMNNAIAYPILRGHDLRSTARTGVHALATGIIEIADDGLSGRSFYLTPGTMFESASAGDGPMGSGRSGGWLWERYGSDFVYKDGQWLYIHEHVCPDFGSNYDNKNWAHDYFMQDINPGPARPLGGPKGGVTDPGPLHQDFNTTRQVQNTCPPPVPYKTLDDENSYAPGHNDVQPLDWEEYTKGGASVPVPKAEGPGGHH